MSLEAYFVSGTFIACVAVSYGLKWLTDRNLAEIKKTLEEVQRTNAEFAEGLALLKYGALDEAIEVCQRARNRRTPA
jgi:hypothetical protein